MADKIFGGSKVIRRVVTDKKEIDRIEHEMTEKVDQVQEVRRNEQEVRTRDYDAAQAAPPPGAEEDADWEAPRSLADFQRLVDLRHPDWSYMRRGVEARLMHMRAPLINKAFLDGLKIGRDLRERSEHGHGWDWRSLRPLAPFERTYVIAKVKAVVLRKH